MSVNYLILTHKDAKQLLRLVNSLDAEWVNFFVHVDKKADIGEFKNLTTGRPNVYYVNDSNRIDGRWGDLSLVEAAFASMRLALSVSKDGHFALLSGQDYPLRSPEYIRNYLEAHKSNNFMSVYPIPDPKKSTEDGGYERLVSWTFDCLNPHDPRMKAKIKPYSFCAKTIGGFIRLLRYRPSLLPKAVECWFKIRKYPDGLSKHFNEFWCVLTRESVAYLIDEYDKREDLKEYYRYTHIPDETLFSSMLCSVPLFENSLLPMCHYINWDTVNGGSPKSLDENDWEDIKKDISRYDYILFARKFESDASLLYIIDRHIKEL